MNGMLIGKQYTKGVAELKMNHVILLNMFHLLMIWMYSSK